MENAGVRLSLGLLMAILTAVESAILCMPLIPLIFTTRGPKDEFSGIAKLAEVVIVGGIAAIVGFAAGYTIALRYYRAETAARIKRILWTLAVSIAVAAVGVFGFASTDTELLSAVVVSGMSLLVGLIVSLRNQ
jgi:hypothetical protein